MTAEATEIPTDTADLTAVHGVVTAFLSADGVPHLTVEARDAHDRAMKYDKPVRAFVAYAGYRGRSKIDRSIAIRDFLLWNDAGRPAPAPKPVAEPAPAEPVVEPVAETV